MSKLSQNYIALQEGKMSRAEFLRQAKQLFPQYLAPSNSFDDAMKILRRRSLLSEELVYQNKADKFPLESIERGIRDELEKMDLIDIHHPSPEQYKRARQRAIDNLCKDPLYYINKIAVNTKQPKEDVSDKMQKVNLKEGRYTDTKPLGEAEDPVQLNKNFLELYIKYKDGNYQVRDKETGELKPGKKLAPEMAAQKACLVIRKKFNVPRYRPDRNAIASCSVGRGKLQYQGENNGIPTFNYAWSLREDDKTPDATAATPAENNNDFHTWTVNDFKIAYVVAEFGKQGAVAIARRFGVETSEAQITDKWIANDILNCTSAAFQFAKSGLNKVVTKQEDGKWLQSYFHTNNVLQAVEELDGKDLNTCISLIEPVRSDDREERRASVADKEAKRLEKGRNRAQEISAENRKMVQDAFNAYKDNRTAAAKAIPDAAKAERVGLVNTFKSLGMGPDDPRRASLWAHLRTMIDMRRENKLAFDSKYGVNDKNAVQFKAKSLVKKELEELTKNSSDPIWTQFYNFYRKAGKNDHDAKILANDKLKKYRAKQQQESLKKMNETLVLRESITKLIGKVLNEAATTNLAQLSDENASVAELPGIINSLENIVTEIESFWLKEQQKIQGVFDQVGNIKNDDGLPVGYKFVQPMLESLKKDLEPVLAKISLNDLKLPEAPAPDQTQVNDPNAEADPNDPNAVPPVPEKQTVFSPAEKEPLQEAKNSRRYTK